MRFDLTSASLTATGVCQAYFIVPVIGRRIAVPYTLLSHINRVIVVTLFMFL